MSQKLKSSTLHWIERLFNEFTHLVAGILWVYLIFSPWLFPPWRTILGIALGVASGAFIEIKGDPTGRRVILFYIIFGTIIWLARDAEIWGG